MFRKSILKNQRGSIKCAKNRVVRSNCKAKSHIAFSTAASTTESKPDAIQNAIRMLTNHHNTNKVNNAIMNEKLNDFEKLIIEAKLSINDCNEGIEDDELLDDDKETAIDAVREAIDVFSDLKYNFQKSFEDEKDEKLSENIQNFAMQLDQLKSELDVVLGETKRGNFLLGLDNIMDKIMYWRKI